MYEYTIINILKSFFTLESLNILRCYISSKLMLMIPEFFIVITRFNRTRFNRTRYNRTQNHRTRNHRTLILSTANTLHKS